MLGPLIVKKSGRISSLKSTSSMNITLCFVKCEHLNICPLEMHIFTYREKTEHHNAWCGLSSTSHCRAIYSVYVIEYHFKYLHPSSK